MPRSLAKQILKSHQSQQDDLYDYKKKARDFHNSPKRTRPAFLASLRNKVTEVRILRETTDTLEDKMIADRAAEVKLKEKIVELTRRLSELETREIHLQRVLKGDPQALEDQLLTQSQIAEARVRAAALLRRATHTGPQRREADANIEEIAGGRHMNIFAGTQVDQLGWRPMFTEDGRIWISSLEPGGFAERCGLLVDDELLSIEGEAVNAKEWGFDYGQLAARCRKRPLRLIFYQQGEDDMELQHAAEDGLGLQSAIA